MRQRGTFWVACGAAGELDVDGVIRPQTCADFFQFGRIKLVTQFADLCEVDHSGGRVFTQPNNGLQMRQFFCTELSRSAVCELWRKYDEHMQIVAGFKLNTADDGFTA